MEVGWVVRRVKRGLKGMVGVESACVDSCREEGCGEGGMGCGERW